MAELVPTVDVTSYRDYPALKMIWQQKINKADLQPAFFKIKDALNQSPFPLYIVVDLSTDPQLPVVDTMMGALRGPFRHPSLAACLVLGSNRSARWVADLLTRSSGRSNIQWFETEAEILTYLSEVNEAAG